MVGTRLGESGKRSELWLLFKSKTSKAVEDCHKRGGNIERAGAGAMPCGFGTKAVGSVTSYQARVRAHQEGALKNLAQGNRARKFGLGKRRGRHMATPHEQLGGGKKNWRGEKN